MSLSAEELIAICKTNPSDPQLKENYGAFVHTLMDPSVKGTYVAFTLMTPIIAIIKEPGMLDEHAGALIEIIVKLLQEATTGTEDQSKKTMNDVAVALFAQLSQPLQANQQAVIKNIGNILLIMAIESNAKWAAYGVLTPILMGNITALVPYVEQLIKAAKVMPQTLSLVGRLYPLKPEAFESQVPDLVELYQKNYDAQSSIITVLWEISKKNCTPIIPYLDILKGGLNGMTTGSMCAMMLQETAQKNPAAIKPLIPDCIAAIKVNDTLRLMIPQVIGYVGQIDEASSQESLAVLWELVDETVARGSDAPTLSVMLQAIKNATNNFPKLILPYLDRVKKFLTHPTDYVRTQAQLIVDFGEDRTLAAIEAKVVVNEAKVDKLDERVTVVEVKAEEAIVVAQEAAEKVEEISVKVEQQELRLDTLEGRVEYYNSQVKASCVTMDDVRKYVDENMQIIKEFIAEIVQKLPVPVKFESSGIVLRTIKLHFECGLKRKRCRYINSEEKDESTFTCVSHDVAKWLKVGIMAVKLGKAIFDKSPGNAVSAAMGIYKELVTSEDDKFKSYISQPFLTSAEKDDLILQLRKERFFDVFNYYPSNHSWCCLRCIDDAEDEKEAKANPALVSAPSSPAPAPAESTTTTTTDTTSETEPMESSDEAPPASETAQRRGSVSDQSQMPKMPATKPSPEKTKNRPPPPSLKGSQGIPGEAIILSGYLKKKGNVLGAMKDRWFVLTNDVLLWAATKDAPKKRGSTPVKDILNVIEADSRVVKVAHPFKLVTRKTTYLMSAPSADDQQTWISTLLEVIKQGA